MSSCPIILNTMSEKQSSKKTVRQLVEELKHPKPSKTRRTFRKPQLNIQFIRSQLKKKWKDPGCGNIQFIKAPVLRGKILNEWQLQHISLAERSYKFPKGYKGYRFDSYSRKFQLPTKDMNSPQFNLYFDKLSARLEDKLYQPDQSISERGDRIKRMITENSIKASIQKQHHKTGLFGYSFRDKFKIFNC